MKRLLCEERVRIPEGCIVEILDRVMTVRGARATSVRDMSHFVLSMDVNEGHVRLRLWNGTNRERSKLITCASVIRNTIVGCMSGYEYTLKVVYKHFPMSVAIEDDGKTVVVKNFLGQKHARRYKMRGDSVARLGIEKDTFVVEGSSLEDVSQSAGTIQENCQVKKIDSRTFLDGIYFLSRSVVSAK